MKVDNYSFGVITIDGKAYHSDVILFPHENKIQEDWDRVHGHSLVLEDIEDVISYKPDVLIVGRGESGVLTVPEKTASAIEELGIKFIAENSGKACQIFNEYVAKGENVVGAFHLTC